MFIFFDLYILFKSAYFYNYEKLFPHKTLMFKVLYLKN